MEAEKSTETLLPLNVGVRVDRRWRSLQELVVAALMVSLVMVRIPVKLKAHTSALRTSRSRSRTRSWALLHEYPVGVGRFGPHFS